MNKRTLGRAVVGGAIALAASAGALQAQQFNFGTRGYFTSPFATCNQGLAGAAMNVSCTGGGFTLSFAGVNPIVGNYLNNSNVSLGSLTLSGTGNVTVPPATVNFAVLVDNTFPTAGVGTFAGFITGSVIVGPGIPQFSSLVWNPNPTTTADGVTYSLILDQISNGVNIPANGNVDIRARAVVTTAPEPGSVVLLSAGMLGILIVGYRRKGRFI